MNRIYANIKLPIDVLPTGEFKMLYDQMKIEVEMSDINKELEEKIMEMKQEMVENILENVNMEEKESEIKIYKNDYPLNRIKKRINTTFRKWTEKNKMTRKKYLPL